MKEAVVYGGIDVAKEQLDIALEHKRWRVANKDPQIRALVRQLQGASAKVQIICEASGGYEQALVRALQEARVPVSLVPPQPGAAVCSCQWTAG